jgi:hypothetical protein
VPLCFQALLLHQEDANAAVGWVMDSGERYLHQFSRDALAAAVRADAAAMDAARRQEEAVDAAALEGVSDATSASSSLLLVRADSGDAPQDAAGDVTQVLEGPARLARAGSSASSRAASSGPVQRDMHCGGVPLADALIQQHRIAMGPPQLELCAIPEGAEGGLALAQGSIVYATRHIGAIDRSASGPLKVDAVRGVSLGCILEVTATPAEGSGGFPVRFAVVEASSVSAGSVIIGSPPPPPRTTTTTNTRLFPLLHNPLLSCSLSHRTDSSGQVYGRFLSSACAGHR